MPPPRLAGVLGLISSTITGLVLLGLLAVYLTLASTVPQMRLWLDTTEQGVYGWWPHLALWFALCVNVSAATVLRVPPRLASLGTYLAHAGVLCVAVGSVWYASHKIDGSVVVHRQSGGGFELVDYFHDGKVRSLYAGLVPAEGEMLDRPRDILQTPLTGLPLRRAADRLSIAAFTPDDSVHLTVTGYRPGANVEFNYRDGGLLPRRGAEVTLGFGPEKQTFVLVAGDEQASAVEGAGFELQYRPDLTPEQIETLMAPAQPAHVLRVTYRGKLVRESLPVSPGQSVDLPEIGRRIQVLAFDYRWDDAAATQPAKDSANAEKIPSLMLRVTPLAAQTRPAGEPATMAATEKSDLGFHRILQAGRPEKTTDFAMSGSLDEMPREGTLVDKDLVIDYTFHDSPAVKGDVMMLVGNGDAAKLLWLTPGGLRGRFDVRTGEAVAVPYHPSEAPAADLPSDHLDVTVTKWYSHAVLRGELTDEPPMPAPRGQEESLSAIKVRVEAGGASDEQWLPFVEEPGAVRPHVISLPDGRGVQLQYSALQRPLGAKLQVRELAFDAYPGTDTPRDYICRMDIREPSAGLREAEVRLNQPVAVGQYRVSQQGWDMNDPHNPSFTVLGITNRPGISVIWLGCFLIAIGLPLAFYVKPILLRRRREAAQGGAA